MCCRKRIPISQNGQLGLREFEESFTFTQFMTEPASKPALLDGKNQTVLIQYRLGFLTLYSLTEVS